jgi:hypothetical protein
VKQEGMKFFRFNDNDAFWVATQIGKEKPVLLTFTSCADASAWNLVCLLEKLALRLGQRPVRVVEYNLQPILGAFRELMDARSSHFDLAMQSAVERLNEFGVDKVDFDDEEALLSYILSTRPQIIEDFLVAPKGQLAA